MRKNGRTLWALEVALVVVVVFALMGVCFWSVSHIREVDRTTLPMFPTFNAEDTQSEKGGIPQPEDMVDGGIHDIIFRGQGVVTFLDDGALVACIRVISDDAYGLDQGGEYSFDFTQRLEQTRLTFDGVAVGDAVEFRYWARTCDDEGTLAGEDIQPVP